MQLAKMPVTTVDFASNGKHQGLHHQASGAKLAALNSAAESAGDLARSKRSRPGSIP
jgi:hypothetical protein